MIASCAFTKQRADSVVKLTWFGGFPFLRQLFPVALFDCARQALGSTTRVGYLALYYFHVSSHATICIASFHTVS